MSSTKTFVPSPTLLLLVITAVTAGLLLVSPQRTTYAQYGGDVGQNVSPEQLARCEQLGIERTECNEVNLLARERVTQAEENPSAGSGTPMLSTGTTETFIYLGVLGAIFGGVAAMFFLRGRGSKRPVTT